MGLAMTLTQLNYFIALAKHRSFGKAAVACGVSQPTLSAQFQKLEEELGHFLVDRQQQPIDLTPLGKAVLKQAQATLDAVSTIPELIAQWEHPLAGVIHIGIPEGSATYVGALLLEAAAQTFPDLYIEFVAAQPETLQQQLNQGSLDAVIVDSSCWTGAGMHYPLFEEPMYVLLPAGHPWKGWNEIPIQAMRDAEFLLPAKGHELARWAAKWGIVPHEGSKRLHTQHMEAYIQMADQNLGPALVPGIAAGSMSPLRQAELKRIQGAMREWVWIAPKGHVLEEMRSPLCRAFAAQWPKEWRH